MAAALHVISGGNINFASNQLTWKMNGRFDNSLPNTCLRSLIGIQTRQQDYQSTVLAFGKFFGCRCVLPCKRKQDFESESTTGHCCAAAMAERPNHNMPRSAARQKMRFSIIEVSRQAVRLVLLDFPRILFLNSCWGHAF